MASQKYDLSKIGFQVEGIPGLTRIENGNLTLEQLSGQDLWTLMSNQVGYDQLELHSRSMSFELGIEMPRMGSEATYIQQALQAWIDSPDTYSESITMSFRYSEGFLLVSDGAVVERPDMSGLANPSDTDQRIKYRFKLPNASIVPL